MDEEGTPKEKKLCGVSNKFSLAKHNILLGLTNVYKCSLNYINEEWHNYISYKYTYWLYKFICRGTKFSDRRVEIRSVNAWSIFFQILNLNITFCLAHAF